MKKQTQNASIVVVSLALGAGLFLSGVHYGETKAAKSSVSTNQAGLGGGFGAGANGAAGGGGAGAGAGRRFGGGGGVSQNPQLQKDFQAVQDAKTPEDRQTALDQLQKDRQTLRSSNADPINPQNSSTPTSGI